MIFGCFSIYDRAADAYLPPFLMPKEAQAKRTFADCINSDSHQFASNPEDYTLFRLGDFDDETGEFLLFRAKESLGNGLEYVHTEVLTATEGPHNGTDPSVKKVSPRASIQRSSPSENPKE